MPLTSAPEALREIPLENISCPVCHGNSNRPVLNKKDRFKIDTRTFSIVRCEPCKFLYVNPRPRPDQLMQYYPETYAFQEEGDAVPDGRISRFFKKCEAFYRNQGLSHDVNRLLAVTKIKKRGTVVEIGCATGDRLRLLREKGYNVTGLEPAPAAREYGRKHFGLSIFDSRLEDWRGPETLADVICIFNVLEHLPYPIQQLKRMASWLTADGTLVIQIPNASSVQAKWLGARWSSMDVPRDLFYFSPHTMELAAEQAGLKIKKIEYGHHWMHPPTLVSSLFPSIDPAVIWGEEGKISGPLKKILWAAATFTAIPLAVIAKLLKQSSLMTLYLGKNL